MKEWKLDEIVLMSSLTAAKDIKTISSHLRTDIYNINCIEYRLKGRYQFPCSGKHTIYEVT